MTFHICYGTQNDCYNTIDSYGEICVGCNCCGLIDKSTMYQCRIATDTRHLGEEREKVDSLEYPLEIQQENIRKNIEWFLKRIKESEERIKEDSNHE